MNKQKSLETKGLIENLKNGVWLVGVSCWLFGITDRSIASFSDGYLSALDLVQLFTAATFFIAWLFLKPSSTKLKSKNIEGSSAIGGLGENPPNGW